MNIFNLLMFLQFSLSNFSIFPTNFSHQNSTLSDDPSISQTFQFSRTNLSHQPFHVPSNFPNNLLMFIQFRIQNQSLTLTLTLTLSILRRKFSDVQSPFSHLPQNVRRKNGKFFKLLKCTHCIVHSRMLPPMNEMCKRELKWSSEVQVNVSATRFKFNPFSLPHARKSPFSHTLRRVSFLFCTGL